MNNNTNEQPSQKNEIPEECNDLELDKETLKEMDNAIDEIPEIKEWDSEKYSDEEKKEIIDVKRKEVENKITNENEMGLELKEDIGEIEGQIKTFKNSLKEKYKGYAEMEANLSQIRGENTEEQEGIKRMKETISSLKGIYEGQLQIKYLEYWKEYKENPDSLLESHAKRNLVMNNLETLAGTLEEAEKGEEEVLKDWVQWVKNNPEITLAALAVAVAAGVAAGALIGPEMMALLAGVGEEQITEEAIKEIGPAAAKDVAKKGILIGVAGYTAGGIIGVGLLGKIASWLYDEKNRDKLAETLLKTKLPWYSYLAEGRPEKTTS